MHEPRKLLRMLAVAVVVVAAIGFVIEIDPGRYRPGGLAPRSPTPPGFHEDARAVEPARSYDDLAKRPWGSGARAGWVVDGALLGATFAELAQPPDVAEHGETRDALRARQARRAYDGAPPVVPHPVASSGAAECIACHGKGMALGALVARPVPHAAYVSCTQCHASAESDSPAEPARVQDDPGSTFEPLRAMTYGPRAWPGAPPAIPHATHMREQCLACHGPGGRAGMRSSHPERASCLQCHAPAASLDQRPVAEAATWPPRPQ
jgi:cytochrome c-type protein NapB